MQKRIDARSKGYWLLSRIVFLFMRIYYRKIYVRGQENVPASGPIIFAPNHKNALMDPLLILYSFPKKQVVFMARGDFFKNPIAAKIFRFLKILPVFRMRDGIGNLDKNEAPFAEAADVLKNNHWLCLMPEGQQVEKRKLLPLVKGMFRIGFQAQEKLENSAESVKIIPVGIEYEDLCYSGEAVYIQYGKPIDLADYYALYKESEPVAYNTLRNDLSPKISELMLNIRSTRYYDEIYLAVLLHTRDYLKNHHLSEEGWGTIEVKQKLVAQYDEMEQTNPQQMDELVHEMQRIYHNFPDKSADYIYRKLQKTSIKNKLAIAICFPLFLLGAIFMVFPYFLIKMNTKKMIDSGFYSTISFVLGIILPALFFIICFSIACLFIPVFYSMIIFLVVAPISSILSFRMKEYYI